MSNGTKPPTEFEQLALESGMMIFFRQRAVCVSVCCVYMCVCVHVSVCMCAFVHVSVCNACVCVFVCLCVVYTCVYVSVYTYMCVCEYLCRCVGLRCKSFVQMIVIRRDVSGRGGEIIHPASGFCFTLQNIYCLSKTNVFAFDKYRRKTALKVLTLELSLQLTGYVVPSAMTY